VGYKPIGLSGNDVHDHACKTLATDKGDIRLSTRKQPFNLLRWFSLISMAVIGTVAVALGSVSTRFVITESVQRDALLTSQFIQAIASAEVRHVAIPNVRTMGELLDPRKDKDFPDVDPMARANARGEFLDHIEHLPDVILANIYAPDRMVIWSTNPALMGTTIHADEDLDQAFASKTPVSASYHDVDNGRMEQKFVVPPEYIFIENYIPLFDADGNNVTAMVEIYKEPKDLISRMERGLVLIWLATALGGGLIYLGLYWIVRRAAILLATQQKQLITNETFVALGEMSSAVAHSLRNPWQPFAQAPSWRWSSTVARRTRTSTTSSARSIACRSGCANCCNPCARSMTSRTGQPGSGAARQPDGLRAADSQGPDRMWCSSPKETPMVLSQQVQLTQILNSVLANALEAMDSGGTLTVTLEPSDSRCVCGGQRHRQRHDREQRAMAFRPFFTTKQGGLGVGLVLVKRIMERFGGAVALDSREGEGTRVRLSFKLFP
jgi:hypothetical protein